MRRRHDAAALVGAGALSFFVWWEGTQREASAAAHWSVPLAGGALALGCGRLGVLRRRRTPAPGKPPAPTPSWHLRDALWPALFLLVAGWDMTSFLVASPDLPTLSDLLGKLTRFSSGRSLLFAAWLAAGAWVLLAPGRGRQAGGPGCLKEHR